MKKCEIYLVFPYPTDRSNQYLICRYIPNHGYLTDKRSFEEFMVWEAQRFLVNNLRHAIQILKSEVSGLRRAKQIVCNKKYTFIRDAIASR